MLTVLGVLAGIYVFGVGASLLWCFATMGTSHLHVTVMVSLLWPAVIFERARGV